MLDTREDRYISSEAIRGTYLSSGSRIRVTDHLYQRQWDSNVRKGGGDRRMWNTSKSITKIQPSNKDVFMTTSAIGYDRLKEKCMFVASCVGLDDEKQDNGLKVGYNVEEVYDGGMSAKKLPQFLRQGSAIPRQIHHKENRTLTMECHQRKQ